MLPDAKRPLLLDGYRALAGTYDELSTTRASRAPHARRATRAARRPVARRVRALPGARRAGAGPAGRDVLGLLATSAAPRRSSRSAWCRASSPPTDWARARARPRSSACARSSCSSTTSTASSRSSRDGVVPAEMVLGADELSCRMLRGIKPPGGVRIHIAGIDLIRDPDGTLRVLEDNLRTPSGVSYVRREPRWSPSACSRARSSARACAASSTTRRSSPRRCARSSPVDPERDDASSCSRPGPYNSAYFEHSFLARTMGLELVEAPDLFVDGDKVFVRTTRGPRRVARDLPPHRRRVPRSRGLPARQPARRARPDARVRRRQRRARQRARQRRRRRQGGLPVRARHDPLLPRRGADPRAGADLRVRARRRSRSTCSSTSTSWWSRRSTRRAATAC